ncbi:isoprenylcysteine carboxylmethyltransferase family protein [bacterium]|nr:isoprenylcysteine carboxylmethyltransferase family protein [bacterium]
MFEKTPSPRIRQIVIGIILVLLGWLSITYSRQYDLVFPHFVILKILGTLFLVVGVMIRILAFKEIHRTHHIKNLATSGIYSKTRNPVYLAFVFIIIGIALLSARLLTFIWTLVSLIVFFWLAKKEESDLERAFGQDYVRYKQKVPMFWPIFWKSR